MDEKAQGAFEYMLILAGVLFIVLAATFLLRGTSKQASAQVNETMGKISITTGCDLVNSSCCWSSAFNECVLTTG